RAVAREVRDAVTTWVRAGGKLIVVGDPWPDATRAGIMPCAPAPPANWTVETLGASDHPFSRGLPLEVTGSHSWREDCAPGDASPVALTRNARKHKRFWLRALPGGGQVALLYEVEGERATWYMGTNYAAYGGDRPDDGLAWNAFLSRLVQGLVHGDRALPVLA